MFLANDLRYQWGVLVKLLDIMAQNFTSRTSYRRAIAPFGGRFVGLFIGKKLHGFVLQTSLEVQWYM